MLTIQMFILKPIMNQEQEYYTIFNIKVILYNFNIKGILHNFNIKGILYNF